ncbi:glutaminase [Luteipulveratus mongoliensis]|nr:glutaminase [Luteipulveratus mongoliensis]
MSHLDAAADLEQVLYDVHREIQPLIGQGQLADYIPALSAVDPQQFGLALATTSGEVHGIGDYQLPFSIQSLSKVYAFALALAADGETIWERVGHEASTHPFNSLLQLEHDHGIPRNPFLNAGALVSVDRLMSRHGSAVQPLREFLRAESGNHNIDVEKSVAESERAHCDRNASLAHLMASYGNLDNPVPNVLDNYIEQCALTMSCHDLALAARFLVRGGVRADGTRLLSTDNAKRINATMLVCGMYDQAGAFAFRVGLPAKSGVGGGVLAVVPNRGVLCVWSPGLDRSGNSVAGVAALEAFSLATGWSVF